MLLIPGEQRDCPVQPTGKCQWVTSRWGLKAASWPNAQRSLDEPRLPGLTIGPLLGCGERSKVYEGRYLGAPVAVKISMGPAPSPEQQAACRAAVADSQSNLVRHENVIHTYMTHVSLVQPEPGPSAPPAPPARIPQQDWVVTQVQELCAFGSMEAAIQRGAFLDADSGQPRYGSVLPLLQQLCRALARFHDLGVMQGPLTPDKVLLSRAATEPGVECKLVPRSDTAAVAYPTRDKRFARASQLRYAAPEVWTQQAVGPFTDVYAFGVLMWELVAGESGWEDLPPVFQAYMVATAHQRPTFPPSAPLPYIQLAMDCMHPDPAQRASASQILARTGSMRAALARGTLGVHGSEGYQDALQASAGWTRVRPGQPTPPSPALSPSVTPGVSSAAAERREGRAADGGVFPPFVRAMGAGADGVTAVPGPALLAGRAGEGAGLGPSSRGGSGRLAGVDLKSQSSGSRGWSECSSAQGSVSVTGLAGGRACSTDDMVSRGFLRRLKSRRCTSDGVMGVRSAPELRHAVEVETPSAPSSPSEEGGGSKRRQQWSFLGRRRYMSL